ncbi:MAG: response regulator [Bacteroidota bacterium]|nr:response regulator [Bacteroidota bacterium]
MYHAHILLIEDNLPDAKLFSSCISEIDPNISVTVITSGHEAKYRLLSSLYNNQRLPDLVVLDINIPPYNGLELLKTFKKVEFLRDIPVVSYTTSNRPEDVERAREFEANAYVVKPLDLEKLMLAVMDIHCILTKSKPVPFYIEY